MLYSCNGNSGVPLLKLFLLSLNTLNYFSLRQINRKVVKDKWKFFHREHFDRRACVIYYFEH